MAKTTIPPRFSVVGIGASAGGLEAFEQFFRALPAVNGMAFVLVPHLDPDHASLLTEILQRSTTMPVIEVQEQMRAAPNHVYVVPPNREMAIYHGALRLSVPDLPRGQRMPIDSFLRSLAGDLGEHAIGIVLSGTGTDGTLGLRAILGAGGVTLVQEPATARYEGMPTSAINAGYASKVLAPEQMPEFLLQLISHGVRPAVPKESAGDMHRILLLLRAATGHDFSLYKKSTIGRRIERRMVQNDIGDLGAYTRYLKENPEEARSLFKEMLINVTSFFRDPEAFVLLATEILPQLYPAEADDYVFRVWVAGCASGEEAYSIAILLREFMDLTGRDCKLQIYATDLDEDAIATARAGVYPLNIAADVSADRLRRFFLKDDAGYRVKKDIREMVVFAIQNVVKDPPFTKLDLLVCRNLMIYMEPELQNQLMPTFHYALRPSGVLFLSPSDGMGTRPELFEALSRKWRFYRAIHTIASAGGLISGNLSWMTGSKGKATDGGMSKKVPEVAYAELTRRLLLQAYAPASVVTDYSGNVLYVHGETGKYLRPAPGQASLNIVLMAREGLQTELRNALRGTLTAQTLNRDVLVKTNGEFHPVRLSVRPLPDEGGGRGLLLFSFDDLPVPVRKSRRKRNAVSEDSLRIEELEQEIVSNRESLQATFEEQQVANEELKSTNEELQSTNEELQSANEELETSHEELQSLNEELTTVNAELQSKIEQLSIMQNDMKNLLDNINIGTIFLDQQLRIRRFTRDAARVYRLVATDIGRPLADIKCNVADENLAAEAKAVMETLIPREREVRSEEGAWYVALIQPYRTLDNVIDGIVLTFTDISQRVEVEAAGQRARALAEAIVDSMREPLLVLDGKLRVISASRSFYHFFQTTAKDTVDRPFYELRGGQWDIPNLRELLENVLPRDQTIDGYVVESASADGESRRLIFNARRIVKSDGAVPLILLAMEKAP